MKIYYVMLIILSINSLPVMAITGVVIAVDRADPSIISVMLPSGLKPARLRLMDTVLPTGAPTSKAADEICRLICHKQIEWDLIDSGVNGLPEVYAYIGSTWINDALIRHGVMQSVAQPHHPDLLNSEQEARLLCVGIWRYNFRRHIQGAVVVDGSKGSNAVGVAFSDVLVKSN